MDIGTRARCVLEMIVLPTDFSKASAEGFAHALRLALQFRCRLSVISLFDVKGLFPAARHNREGSQRRDGPTRRWLRGLDLVFFAFCLF